MSQCGNELVAQLWRDSRIRSIHSFLISFANSLHPLIHFIRYRRQPSLMRRGALQFFESPRDEISLLAPIKVTAASFGTFAFTVSGAVAESPTVASCREQ